MYFGFGRVCNPRSPRASDPDYYCNEETGRWNKRRSTRTRKRRSTRSKKRRSTRTRKRRSTRSKKRRSTRTRKRRSTRSKKRRSTRTRKRRSTRSKKRSKKQVENPRKKFVKPDDLPDVNTLMSPKNYSYSDEKLLNYKAVASNIVLWKTYIKNRYGVCTSRSGLIFNYLNEDNPRLMNVLSLVLELTLCKHRFLLDFIAIAARRFGGGHANGILIDREAMKIYHFEPNGVPLSRDHVIVNKALAKALQDAVSENFFLKEYTLVSSYELCPYMGPQVLEDVHKGDRVLKDEPGYCMVWVMLFLHYCITNPTVSPENIINYLLSKEDLTHILRGYIMYLIDAIKFTDMDEEVYKDMYMFQ